jgi:multidrug efflux pump subunit AcrA (membrane-fusion protein)
MNASVRIIVAERNDVIEVPIDAVAHDDEDQATVEVIGSDGKTSTRQVKLGLANNKSVEVVHGLQVGEHLAVEAASGPEEE